MTTTRKKTGGKKTGKAATRRYGPRAAEKVERALHELKEGRLRSGRSGRKVTSRAQAIAIGLAEARAEGGRVPKPRAKPARKGAARKAARRTPGR